MNSILYLCALCLCMKAQSLEALPLVALVLSFCGVWFKDWFGKWRFQCIFHLAHRPPSVNTWGTVLGSNTFLGVEENSSWQKSIILSCEGSCHSTMQLLSMHCEEWEGKAKIIFVKYLLIVPYPSRLTFPSYPGANTGATPWSSPGMKKKKTNKGFCCCSITHFPHVVFPLAAASSGSYCFLSWTLDTLRVEFSIWFLPPRICCLVCEGFSTNAAVYFCALNNGTQTE